MYQPVEAVHTGQMADDRYDDTSLVGRWWQC